MAGIKIKWLSDISDAIRGNKSIRESIEDVTDELRDLEREGSDSFRELAQDADKAGDKIKKSVGGGLDEAKGEAKQSGREAAASFSGGFDDVADFVQETIANAFGGFGPVGAAAGIAVAAIIGTVMSNAQAAQEALADSRDRAIELANTMYENGGELPLTDRVSELFDLLAKERTARNPFESIADGFVDLGTNIDIVREAADAADKPVESFLKALTGSDIQDTKDALQLVNDEMERLAEESGNVDFEDWVERKGSLEGVRTELEKVVRETELANDLYTSTEFMNTKRVEDLAAAWENAGVKVADYFTEGEDGAKSFDVASYISDWETQIAQAAEIKADLIGLPTSIREEAERQWAAGGVGAADAYVDAYQGADAATRAKLEAIAGPQGQAAGAAAANGFVSEADAIARGWQPPQVYIPVGVQDNTAAEMERIVSRLSGRTVTVGVGTVLKPGVTWP